MRTSASLYTHSKFEEHQTFQKWWLWLFLLAIVGGSLAVFVQVAEDNHDVYWLLSFVVVVPLLIVVLLYRSLLKTKITAEGIYVYYRPFVWTKKLIPWKEIRFAKIREYSPLKEYGGWGIRYSFRNGKAYNVKGNKGLQIELVNGKKILIGTQKPEEVQAMVDRYLKTSQR